MRTIVLALSLLTLATPSLRAQLVADDVQILPAEVTPSLGPTGTLSGHVICADTNGPARFAQVMLRPVAAPRNVFETNATVRADGTYLFVAVPPGTYYLHALVPGYADPFATFSAADFESNDPAVRALIAKSAPTVTINGTESARMDLRIERGAAITGRILYDDGAPAQNWAVFAHKASKEGLQPAIYVRANTDDLGRFRLAGLPAGEYILIGNHQGSMLHGNSPANQMPDQFTIGIFSGSTSFAWKAQTITVTTGEERSGEDMTVPLHNLHRISGQVVAKANSRPINSGSVTLTTADESAFVGSAGILTDGSFTFDFIPGNTTYTLTVDLASEISEIKDPPPGTNPTLRHDFGTSSTQITLRDGDADNIVVAVPEAVAAAQE